MILTYTQSVTSYLKENSYKYNNIEKMFDLLLIVFVTNKISYTTRTIMISTISSFDGKNDTWIIIYTRIRRSNYSYNH